MELLVLVLLFLGTVASVLLVVDIVKFFGYYVNYKKMMKKIETSNFYVVEHWIHMTDFREPKDGYAFNFELDSIKIKDSWLIGTFPLNLLPISGHFRVKCFNKLRDNMTDERIKGYGEASKELFEETTRKLIQEAIDKYKQKHDV